MKRFVSLVLAAVFPLSLFSWFVPAPYNQLDFILLWLFAMVAVALPTVYAEIGLAQRSSLPPIAGMQKLTRDADASMVWRGFIWGGVLLSFFVSALLINSSSASLYPLLTTNMGMDVQSFVLPPILMVVATIASVWGLRTAIAGLVLVTLSLVLNISPDVCLSLNMTETSLQEWGRAVILALVSVGAGSGIYWFVDNMNKADTTDTDSKNNNNKKKQLIATKTVLPIWIVQVVTGTIALLLLALSDGNQTVDTTSVLVNSAKSLGLLCVSAVLLHFISQLLKEKLGLIKSLLATLVVALSLSLLPSDVLRHAVIFITLGSALLLSIFAGWKMKISHLRKSMNFGNEAKYNLWRVAIRLVVPLSVVFAFVGWIQALMV